MSLSQLASFQWNGVQIGEHGRAGAIRYLKSDLSRAGQHAEALLRRFCAAAMLTTLAYQRILERYRPTGLLARHGVYVPQGVVTEMAQAFGINLVTWMPSYRKNTVLFASGDTYHKVMIKPLDYKLPVLTVLQTQELRKYLADRETGASDWISFSSKSNIEDGIAEALKLDSTKPIVTLYTNVAWDAQVHFDDNLFEGMFDWLRATVQFLTTNYPDIQIVVRVHPGELVGQLKSEQPVAREMRSWREIDFRQVRIVDAGSKISSYSLAGLSKFVVIYASKIGIELAARGVRVLVAGEAWVKNKGISIDPSSREAYFSALEQLVETDATSVNIEAAERYAYHVFFRVMRNVSSLATSRGYPPFRVSKETTSGNRVPDTSLESVIDFLTGNASHI